MEIILHQIYGNVLIPKVRDILSVAKTNGFIVPNERTILAINTFIKKAMHYGLWEKFDYFLNGAYNDINMLNFSRIDWRFPHNIRDTSPLASIGSDVDYTTYGWKFKGLETSVINTNFLPSNAQRKSTKTNLHYASVVYDRSDVSVINDTLISAGFSNTRETFFAANNSQQRIASENSLVNLNASADLTGTGLKTISRTSSNDVILSNKSTIINRTSVGGELPVGSIFIGRNSTTRFSKLGLSNFSIGQVINDKTELYRQLYNEFLTEIGLNPIA